MPFVGIDFRLVSIIALVLLLSLTLRSRIVPSTLSRSAFESFKTFQLQDLLSFEEPCWLTYKRFGIAPRYLRLERSGRQGLCTIRLFFYSFSFCQVQAVILWRGLFCPCRVLTCLLQLTSLGCLSSSGPFLLAGESSDFTPRRFLLRPLKIRVRNQVLSIFGKKAKLRTSEHYTYWVILM